MRNILSILATSTLLLIAALPRLPTVYGQTEGQDFLLEQGLIYKSIGEDNLSVNIAAPAKGEGPFPCIVYVPWSGVASYNTGAAINAAVKGYVGVVVDYRRNAAFPVPIMDVKCATVWLSANAARFRLDPRRFIFIGGDFGGYVALMAAYTNESQIPTGDCPSSASSYRIRAVVSLASPTDWTTIDPSGYASLMGSKTEMKEEFTAKGSPLTWIQQSTPPTLIFHGDINKRIPIRNSFLLNERLTQYGVEHVFLILENEASEIQDHWYDQVVWEFIQSHLQ